MPWPTPEPGPQHSSPGGGRPAAPALASLTTREVERLLADGPLDVIVPLGALEQHGPHLPLSTDQIIAEALASEAAARAGECAVAPCLPVGVSPHHLGFAGTASVAAETMAEVQADVVASLLSHGFGCAYVVTGHAGNAGSMAEAERRLAESFAGRVVSFADWPAQRKAVHAAAEAMGLDPERVGTHAGHFETSIMCLLRPDLVDSAAAEPGWIGPAAAAGETLRSRGMAALSPIGVIGDPAGASAEAGRAYLDALVDHVVSGIARHRGQSRPAEAPAAAAGAPVTATATTGSPGGTAPATASTPGTAAPATASAPGGAAASAATAAAAAGSG